MKIKCRRINIVLGGHIIYTNDLHASRAHKSAGSLTVNDIQKYHYAG